MRRRATLMVFAMLLATLAPTQATAEVTSQPEATPVAAAYQPRDLLFEAAVDATKVRYPKVAASWFRAPAEGKHRIDLTWAGTADLKLFVSDEDGRLIGFKGNQSQPKRLVVDLDAGARYRVRVRAASGVANFRVWIRAPEMDVNAFFDGLPTWEDIYTKIDLDPTHVRDSGWAPNPADPSRECRYRTYKFGASPSTIVTFGLHGDVLWPGVILQGDRFDSALMSELPIRQREPIAVFLDLSADDIRRSVVDPTPGKLAAAVGGIIETAEQNGYEPGTDIDYAVTETFNATQFALGLDVSAKHMKTKVRATLDMEREVNESSVTVAFVESAFTASAELPQTPGDFFSDALTPELLSEQIRLLRVNDSNIPVFVKSVTYGRMMMFSVTSSARATEVIATINALHADDFQGEAAVEYRKLIRNSTTKLATIGGSSDAARRAIQTGDFRQYFAADTALTQYVPISYVLQDLRGTTTYVGETTTYKVPECRPVNADVVDVEFVEAALIDFTDPDFTGNRYELHQFFLEARPLDGNVQHSPVFTGNEYCEMWDPQGIDGLRYLGESPGSCWKPPAGSDFEPLRRGDVWRPALADGWILTIHYDNALIADARLRFRVGFQDRDPANKDDWTRDWNPDDDLIGEAIWADHTPDPDSTYVFRVATAKGGTWDVYLKITRRQTQNS